MCNQAACGATLTDSLRYVEDYTNVVDNLLSQNTKPVWLVQVQNDQLDFDAPTNTRVISKTRITIADGYRANIACQDAPYDGYLNPRVEQVYGNTQVFSAGQLSENTFLIGSLVYPYTLNGVSGGYDPIATFQPTRGANKNLQVYLQIGGLGTSVTVNYYEITELILTGKGIQEGISFKLRCKQANVNLDL